MANEIDPLCVWVLADHKPGHRSQLQGLIAELQYFTPLNVHWLDAEALPLRVSDWLRRRWPQAIDIPRPDLVIGAGSASQGLILLARHVFGCMAVVLMRPSLPLSCYDAAIVPRHDHPPQRDNILVTRGVLNMVPPRTNAAVADQHTFLIGGVSKHFVWSTEAVIQQIQDVASHRPQTAWVLTNSRRTPDDFAARLQAAALPNVSFLPHTETPPGWLAAQLSRSQEVWVTPDSVSMVYEAITSGAATGLFTLTPQQKGRIHDGLEDILAAGFCTSFDAWQRTHVLPPSREPLHEARRSAQWLIERYRQWKKQRRG